MYFVKSGHLHVLLDIHGGERLVVAEIGSGEMLGELSFFRPPAAPFFGRGSGGCRIT
jgi:CRP-like cAMP-binding protein